MTLFGFLCIAALLCGGSLLMATCVTLLLDRLLDSVTRVRRRLPFLAVVALALGALSGPALAADAVVASRSWLDMLLSFLASDAGYLLLSAVGAVGVAELRRRGVNETVLSAVESGAGLAYSRIVRSGLSATSPGLIAGAVAEGADYVQGRVPGGLKKRKIDREALHHMVDARLGKMLAAGPLVLGQTLEAFEPTEMRTFGPLPAG